MPIEMPLPFFDERTAGVDMLVLHSVAYPAAEASDKFRSYRVSAHYLVDFDGKIYRCVPEDKRAWHAGNSFWRGVTDINSRAVGIEVCHRSLGQSKFNKKQIAALIPLCREIVARYGIKPQMIVGHSDIAPLRKVDPGKCFPWAELAAADVGIWYGSRFAEEKDAVKMLAEIGYQTEGKDAAAAAMYAFCRRFLPVKVSRVPVRKAEATPFPDNCAALLQDNECIHRLQNICMQYRLYGQLK